MNERTDHRIEQLLLKAEVESFLTREADLLDARRFDEWLALLTDDFRLWAPLTRNIAADASELEHTREGLDANWLDEGIDTLRQRVRQLATGSHWAEEPPSRTVRMFSNLDVLEVKPLAPEATDDGQALQEIRTACRFLLYRNRLEDEENSFLGRRHDTLRRYADGNWRLARREVYLAQNVLLAKNLSVFF